MKTTSLSLVNRPSNIFQSGIGFLLLLCLSLLVFSCDKDQTKVKDDEDVVTEKEGIEIKGPGIFEVEGDLATLTDGYVLPDFSQLTAEYQIEGNPKGDVYLEQEPVAGTVGFEEGMVVHLSAADQGGNTAKRDVIFTLKKDVSEEERNGIVISEFLQENETAIPADIHLTSFEFNEEFVSLDLVLAPAEGEVTLDPFILNPAQITLHLYDEELKKVNQLTYPDGIWEPSSQLESYITPCGAFLRFNFVPVTDYPTYIAITGGTFEQQRFSAQTNPQDIKPLEAVIHPTCEPKVPMQVEEDVAEPCKCIWRSNYIFKEKWFRDSDPEDCFGGSSSGNIALKMAGAKPFAYGSAVDECVGGAGDVATSGSRTETLEVWVECTPRPCPECCVPKGNCSASPSFTAYANLNPPGTAVSGGRIKITGSGGCTGLTADAVGATRSSSQVDESVKFTIGVGENSSIEVLPLSKSDGAMTGTFSDTDTKSGSSCDFTLHGIGLGNGKCLADADLFNWYAYAEIQLHQSVTDMLIKTWCEDGSSGHSNLGNAFEAEGKEK